MKGATRRCGVLGYITNGLFFSFLYIFFSLVWNSVPKSKSDFRSTFSNRATSEDLTEEETRLPKEKNGKHATEEL